MPAQDQGSKEELCCPGLWYTSESCPCRPTDKCKECKHGTCKGGDACPCIAELKKGTGTLVGTVTHKSVEKFPTVVHIESMGDRVFSPPKTVVRMDQKDKTFQPQVVPVLVGTTVEFLNSDPFEHNIKSVNLEKFDLGNWGQGEKRTYAFRRAGVYELQCAVHPEMVGSILATGTPYFAVADNKGNFRIPNVPAGQWKVKIWNERLKPKQVAATFDVQVKEGVEARLEIKP